MPIEVCITSILNSASAVISVIRNCCRSPNRWCSERSTARKHGLGFLLETFSEFGVQATFFVEALQTAYFGDEPMAGSPEG